MARDRSHEAWKDRRIVPADEKDFLNIVRDAPRDPPSAGIFDSPTRCYKVNQEWAGHLMGAVTALELWKAWAGTEDDRNPSVQAVSEFLIGEDCTVFKLRQNPDNPCQLQQSLDGGDTWTLAFDYSLCAGAGSVFSATIYIDLAITNIENNQTNYHDEGDIIINVFPNLEYDTTPGDLDRDAALCYALKALVAAIFDGALATANEELNKARFFSFVVDFTANAFGLVEETLLGALARSVVELIFGTAALEDAIDALENETARCDVQCCMYTNLVGSTVTEAAWATAGDGCAFAPGSDPDKLLTMIAPLFDDLDTYLSLMAILSDAVTVSEAGLIENDCVTCESGGDAWRVRFDGDEDDLEIDQWERGTIEPDARAISSPNVAFFEEWTPQATGIVFWVDLGSDRNVIQVSFWYYTFNDPTPQNSVKRVELFDSSRVLRETISETDADPFEEWVKHTVELTYSGTVRYVRIYLVSSLQGLPWNNFLIDNVEIITAP